MLFFFLLEIKIIKVWPNERKEVVWAEWRKSYSLGFNEMQKDRKRKLNSGRKKQSNPQLVPQGTWANNNFWIFPQISRGQKQVRIA